MCHILSQKSYSPLGWRRQTLPWDPLHSPNSDTCGVTAIVSNVSIAGILIISVTTIVLTANKAGGIVYLLCTWQVDQCITVSST